MPRAQKVAFLMQARLLVHRLQAIPHKAKHKLATVGPATPRVFVVASGIGVMGRHVAPQNSGGLGL